MGWFDFLSVGDKMTTPVRKAAASRDSESGAMLDYEAWYEDQIRLGLEDIEAGRVVTHEEFLASGQALLQKLKRKHAKAA